MSTRPDSLRRLMNPNSIAVIGASDRPGSLGHRTMQNLDGFTGQLWPINPRLEWISAHRCHPAIADLPGVPDCAILAVPAAAVEAELQACADLGVGGCVVFASGYAELADPDGAARQARLAGIARAAGMRLLGPNTTGFARFATGAHAGFAEFPGGVAPGQAGIALISQSGAMGLALAQSARHGTGLSHVMTCGNSADVDVADLVVCAAQDPEARAIALLFEGIAAPERLVAAIAAAGKPVAVFRLGASAPGQAAVRWHTGTDPQPGFDWNGQFAGAGAVLVAEPEHLIETAVFLAKMRGCPPRPMPRVAILSSSGGSGILAADRAVAAGLALAEPGAATVEALKAALPAFASARNPCDATAQATADPAMLTRCAGLLLDDPAVDALVLPWGKAWDNGQFAALSELAAAANKPFAVVWLSQWLEGPGAAAIEAAPNLALFRSMASCMAALAAWGRG